MWLESVYEEHLSEAAFLWTQWEQALRDPRYTLTEVAVLEERLLAHLDALVIGGAPVSEALLAPALAGEDPGEVFVAAFASIAEAPLAALEAVMARVPAAPVRTLPALRRALELSGREGLGPALIAGLKAPDAATQALTLEVLSFRNEVPAGMALELLRNPDEAVAAAALRAMGTAPRQLPEREVVAWMTDPRPEVRWRAVELNLLTGSHAAWNECRKEVEARGPALRKALVFLALGGDDKDLARLLALAEDETVRAEALWALGFTGRVAAAETCLELTRQQQSVARLAGEAFSAITGLKLEGKYVAARQDEEAESLPLLEEEDLDLNPKPEDWLPDPAPAALSDWWQGTRKGFAKEQRYLGGQPFGGATLLDALTGESMRRRHVHALELALRTQGAQQVRTLALTRRQFAETSRAATLRERLSRQPLVHFAG